MKTFFSDNDSNAIPAGFPPPDRTGRNIVDSSSSDGRPALPPKPTVVAAAFPTYLPAASFFQLMAASELFLLADHTCLSSSSNIHRCRIRNRDGQRWLSVPILRKGHFGQKISEARIDTTRHWRRKHWRNIIDAYRQTPYFDFYSESLSATFERNWTNLVDLNLALISLIRDQLGISTPLRRCTDLSVPVTADAGGQIISLLQAVGTGTYLVHPSNKFILDETQFSSAGIRIRYLQPSRLLAKSEGLSIIDDIFRFGPQTSQRLTNTGSSHANY